MEQSRVRQNKITQGAFTRTRTYDDVNLPPSNSYNSYKKTAGFKTFKESILPILTDKYDPAIYNINTTTGKNGLLGDGSSGRVNAIIGSSSEKYARKSFTNLPRELRDVDDLQQKIKSLDYEVLRFGEIKDFYYEIQWAKLNNKYITKINGWAISKEKKLQIIMERGKPFNSTLSIITNIKYLLDISKGLLYLHNLNYVHQDIKPDNILIFDKIAKIADFGSMVDITNIDPLLTNSAFQVTPSYTDPLKLTYFFSPPVGNGRPPGINKSDDIYSFGLILLSCINIELLTTYVERVRAIATRDEMDKGYEIDEARVDIIIADYMGLYKVLFEAINNDMRIPNLIKDILKKCVCENGSRINATELVTLMKTICTKTDDELWNSNSISGTCQIDNTCNESIYTPYILYKAFKETVGFKTFKDSILPILTDKYDQTIYNINTTTGKKGLLGEGSSGRVNAIIGSSIDKYARKSFINLPQELRDVDDLQQQIKSLEYEVLKFDKIKDFYYEIRWAALNNEYITKINGWAISKEKELQIIMERGTPFCNFLYRIHNPGNIDTNLGCGFFDNPHPKQPDINIHDLLDLFTYLLCISKGLLYLHNESIIHQDIKPDNILIFDKIAKITDFGTMVDITNIDPLHAGNRPSGTSLYMDPEKIEKISYGISDQKDHIKREDDIFSFGITFMICMGYPFMHDYNRQVIHVNESMNSNTKYNILKKSIASQLRGNGPIQKLIKYILTKCVCKCDNRMKAKELVTSMTTLVDLMDRLVKQDEPSNTIKTLRGIKLKDYMVFIATFEDNPLITYAFRFDEIKHIIDTCKNPTNLLRTGYNWTGKKYKSKREESCKSTYCNSLKDQLNKLDLIKRIALKQKIMSVSPKYTNGLNKYLSNRNNTTNPLFPMNNNHLFHMSNNQVNNSLHSNNTMKFVKKN